jgi:hypothetical protein
VMHLRVVWHFPLLPMRWLAPHPWEIGRDERYTTAKCFLQPSGTWSFESFRASRQRHPAAGLAMSSWCPARGAQVVLGGVRGSIACRAATPTAHPDACERQA